jgi:prolipoprotein diacylglyceryltransferase
VAAVAGVVLYAETGWLINTAAMYNPVDYVMPELIYEAITECLLSFGLMAIIWTAFTSLRGGGEPAWILVLAAAAGLFGLELYRALNMNIDFTYWLLPLVDPDTLANILLTVQWLSFGALLAALLIGLRTVTPDDPVASEGAPQPDSATSLDVATP